MHESVIDFGLLFSLVSGPPPLAMMLSVLTSGLFSMLAFLAGIDDFIFLAIDAFALPALELMMFDHLQVKVVLVAADIRQCGHVKERSRLMPNRLCRLNTPTKRA